MIDRFSLAKFHVQARALSCDLHRDGLAVGLSSGESLMAENVLLAIGASEQPYYPDWVGQQHARIHHAFAPDFDGWPSRPETVVVVGGGGGLTSDHGVQRSSCGSSLPR